MPRTLRRANPMDTGGIECFGVIVVGASIQPPLILRIDSQFESEGMHRDRNARLVILGISALGSWYSIRSSAVRGSTEHVSRAPPSSRESALNRPGRSPFEQRRKRHRRFAANKSADARGGCRTFEGRRSDGATALPQRARRAGHLLSKEGSSAIPYAPNPARRVRASLDAFGKCRLTVVVDVGHKPSIRTRLAGTDAFG